MLLQNRKILIILYKKKSTEIIFMEAEFYERIILLKLNYTKELQSKSIVSLDLHQEIFSDH